MVSVWRGGPVAAVDSDHLGETDGPIFLFVDVPAREGPGRDRGERGLQQHAGRCVGDNGQHAGPPQEPHPQRQAGRDARQH